MCQQMDILHRDLKAENVLVGENGEPVIADFEACQLGSPSGTTTSIIVGSGASAAPELLTLGHSTASDMYSFGILMQRVLLGAPSPEAQEIMKQLLSSDPAQRPSAGKLLLSPFFSSLPLLHRCIICFENFTSGDGVGCGGGGMRGSHFVCRSDFNQLVVSFVGDDLRVVERHRGYIRCPMAVLQQCDAPPFSDHQVAVGCTSAVFAQFVGVRLRLAEREMANEVEREAARRVAVELERLSVLDERARRVFTTSALLREQLNNACPRCHAVFGDFDGCCALTCHRCGAGFCAWCLRDCGTNAHAHVVSCDNNLAPGQAVFTSVELWKQGCTLRRRGMVTECLSGLSDRALVRDILDAVSPELAELGLLGLAHEFQ